MINSPVNGQIPELPDQDHEVYYGLYWGAAGISKVLLQMSQFEGISVKIQQKAMKLAESALQSIWENRWNLANGTKYATWPKHEGSVIYPSQKYGTAGIVKTFLTAYDMTGNPKYLEWSEEAIKEVYKEAINSNNAPRWSYSYRDLRGEPGIYITDLSFGSMGIIDTTLDLYTRTSNSLYLDLALNATEWVYSISYQENIANTDGKIIPWYQSSQRINNTFTTYNQGNSGAINVLIKISSLVNDTKWLEWAKFLIKWLILNQNPNGSWNGEVNTNQELVRLDFDGGVAGILFALEKAKKFGLNVTSLSESIQSASEWILDQKIRNSTYNFFPSVENSETGKFGYFDGMTGILKVLKRSHSPGELQDEYTWLIEYATNNYEIGDKNLILMKPYIHLVKAEYYDLSYANGLAGLLEELMEIYSEFDNNLQEKISDIVELSIQTYDYFVTKNSLWPRQIRLDNMFLETTLGQIIIISALLIIGLLSFTKIRKK